MIGPFIFEMNLVAFLFAVALFAFLRALRRDKDENLRSFLKLLLFSALIAWFSFAISLALNLTASETDTASLTLARLNFFVPLLFILLLNGLYLTWITGALRERRRAIAAILFLPILPAGLIYLLYPRLNALPFLQIIACFLLYFIFETPPFKQLTKRIAQLEEANEAAKKAWEEAKEEDRAMNEFLKNMSHEIRTPLTAILGFDEMIAQNASDKEIRDYAADISGAGNTLLYIINDILDFSKIESGETELTVSAYHLSEVLHNIETMIGKKAQDKNLVYRSRIDGSIPETLTGDSVRVTQILLNLLNNAVKYTKDGFVELRITGERSNAEETVIELKAEVEDSGIGIKEEDLPHLFDSFTRLEERKNREIEGTGLGLTITSRLLTLMGGTMQCKSDYGKGSVFTVTIPQQIADTVTMAEYTKGDREAAKHATVLAPDASMLLVDDNSTNRLVVIALLRSTKIQIDPVESGEEALQKVAEKKYDLILLDQMMPGLSGPETLKRMREMKEDNLSASASVIAFTADAIAGARERLLSQGFDDYLSKPVKGSDLMDLLRRHLPAELVSESFDAAFMASMDATKNEEEETDAGNEVLSQLGGINRAAALNICGSEDVLLAAAKDFYLTIDQQSDLIEHYLEEEDYQNYTIKVHALKSAARFIGAEELSKDAAFLESCGKSGEIEEIRSRTGALLSLYRSYKEHLKAVAPDGNRNEEDLPLLEGGALQKFYHDLKAYAHEFDFDALDDAMEELDGYRVPEEEQAKCKAIRTCIQNVNREGLLSLL